MNNPDTVAIPQQFCDEVFGECSYCEEYKELINKTLIYFEDIGEICEECLDKDEDFD